MTPGPNPKPEHLHRPARPSTAPPPGQAAEARPAGAGVGVYSWPAEFSQAPEFLFGCPRSAFSRGECLPAVGEGIRRDGITYLVEHVVHVLDASVGHDVILYVRAAPPDEPGAPPAGGEGAAP